MSGPSLIIEPEAEADILEAYQWYEKRQDGLGNDFVDCVDDAFERILHGPEQFAIVHQGVRQALVRRFPYVICFLVETTNISVIAVFHCRRNPKSWQSRLK